MAFCTSCGSTIADGASFCPACGQRQNAAANPGYQAPGYEQPAAYQPPVYSQQPSYQAPSYEQPYQTPVYQQNGYETYQYQAAPVSKGKAIAGMILGIIALVLAVVDLILAIAGLAVLGYRGAEEAGVGIMVYAIITLGFALPGMILGKSTSSITPGKLGKVFGLIGVIMAGIAFFVAILCMAV